MINQIVIQLWSLVARSILGFPRRSHFWFLVAQPFLAALRRPRIVGRSTQHSSQGLSQWNARDGRPLGRYIFATQLSERIRDKFGGHFLAPTHIEVRIVQRFSDAGSKCSSFCYDLRSQRAPHKKLASFGGRQGARSYRADDDPSLFNHAI